MSEEYSIVWYVEKKKRNRLLQESRRSDEYCRRRREKTWLRKGRIQKKQKFPIMK